MCLYIINGAIKLSRFLLQGLPNRFKALTLSSASNDMQSTSSNSSTETNDIIIQNAQLRSNVHSIENEDLSNDSKPRGYFIYF
jgi:hypothetical protein